MGIFGLAFGSFLNLCVSRWPEEESVIAPRSHCRHCGRTLAWQENLPLVSWLALHGRCRTCKASIGWRYPIVELTVAVLWAYSAWQMFTAAPELASGILSYNAALALIDGIAQMIFFWLLVALAVLDFENLWLPDFLTWPGIGLGLVLAMARTTIATVMNWQGGFAIWEHVSAPAIVSWFLGALICGAVIIIIRFVYKAFRDQEGVGLGDAKLMAMLGGWLGVKGGLLSLGIGVILGALIVLVPRFFARRHESSSHEWWLAKVPFGTYLCIGGIISGLWHDAIVAAYLRLSGI